MLLIISNHVLSEYSGSTFHECRPKNYTDLVLQHIDLQLYWRKSSSLKAYEDISIGRHKVLFRGGAANSGVNDAQCIVILTTDFA